MSETISLIVKKSEVKTKGIARIHKSVAEKLGVEKEDFIDVVYSNRHVTVRVAVDEIVGKNEIIMREPDMVTIGVRETEEVEVKKHIPVTEKAKEEIEKLKDKAKEEIEKIKKKGIEITEKLKPKPEE